MGKAPRPGSAGLRARVGRSKTTYSVDPDQAWSGHHNEDLIVKCPACGKRGIKVRGRNQIKHARSQKKSNGRFAETTYCEVKNEHT